MPYFTIPTLHDYQTMATPFFIWFSFTDVVAFSAFSKISYKNALLFKTIVIQYLPQYTSYEETTADNLCNNISLSKNQYNFELRLDIVNARIDSCFFHYFNVKSGIWFSQENTGQGRYTVCTIIFIIFWDFLVLYQIFLSQSVKRCALLLMHMVYSSCFTSCRTTYNLGS